MTFFGAGRDALGETEGFGAAIRKQNEAEGEAGPAGPRGAAGDEAGEGDGEGGGDPTDDEPGFALCVERDGSDDWVEEDTGCADGEEQEGVDPEGSGGRVHDCGVAPLGCFDNRWLFEGGGHDLVDALDEAAGVFDEPGAEEGSVEELACEELRGFRAGGAGLEETADEEVARVDFEADLRGRGILFHGAEHGAHLGAHACFVGEEGDDRAVAEAFGDDDFLDAVAEGFLHPLAEGLAVGGGEAFAFRFRGVWEFEVVGVCGDECFAAVVLEGVGDVFVDWFGEVDDFEPAGFESFEVGAVFDGAAAGCLEEVDDVLAFFLAGEVLVEGC